MAVKLLRTIRLDASDSFIYDPPAEPGEWAVPGGFKFWDCDPRTLTGRPKQAFRAGFLGIGSFGWSTLAVVSEASVDERAAAVEALARHILLTLDAPNIEAARRAAEDEIAFTQELADHPIQTLVALHRSVGEDGHVAEQFRTFAEAQAKQAAAMPCSAGAFAIVPDDDSEGDPGETVDLAAIVAGQAGVRGT